ncbi:MAG: hypothetical protein ACI86P_002315 [Flavobacteriales bacterium]
MLFDSWGDGWDNGNIVLTNSEGVIVFEGTLSTGFGAQNGEGWQNEFYPIRIRATDFLSSGDELELSAITNLKVLLGGDYGSATGAMGIDDIELVSGDPQVATGIDSQDHIDNQALVIFPNPANELVNVVVNGFNGELWKCAISNVGGEIVWSENSIGSNRLSVQTKNWSKGVYFIKTETSKGVTNGKFVVN